jgi:hypothetical protein
MALSYKGRTSERGASVVGAKVWRLRGTSNSQFANITQINGDLLPWNSITSSNLDSSSYSAWRDSTLKEIPEGEDRERVRQALSILDPAPEKNPRNVWDATPANETEQSVFLTRLACSNDGETPYVARALLNSGRLLQAGVALGTIIEGLRKSDCRGTEGLTDADWEKLEEFDQLYRK